MTTETVHKVFTYGDSFYTVDTEATESNLRPLIHRAEPFFFQKTSGRKRELFSFYKGCLIAHFTGQGTGWKTRFHVPYLVDALTGQTFCLEAGCRSNYQAKQIIDQAIETGRCRETPA
jgi:hypothetical protein